MNVTPLLVFMTSPLLGVRLLLKPFLLGVHCWAPAVADFPQGLLPALFSSYARASPSVLSPTPVVLIFTFTPVTPSSVYLVLISPQPHTHRFKRLPDVYVRVRVTFHSCPASCISFGGHPLSVPHAWNWKVMFPERLKQQAKIVNLPVPILWQPLC